MSLHCNTINKLLTFVVLLFLSLPALGHGALVTWELRNDSVHVFAAFDDGTPMDNAQILVFSGAEPSVPALSGITDDNGNFVFLVNREESLTWDVQVRKAGHGDMVHISLTEESETIAGQRGFTPIQIILMAVCVVWGFIGTALFFASKKRDVNAHS